MKLRLPGRRTDAATTPDASDDLTAQLVKSGGKGRPTPKRSEAQGRRQGPPPPPPTTRKEAYSRMRETQAANRGAGRAGAPRADDYLPARDRGPERRLVRNIVDSRRNIGSVFMLIAVLLLASYAVPSLAARSWMFAVWFGFFILVIIDSFVLGRKIRRAVTERFPDTKVRMRSLTWYGISRSTMIRRWRFPKPEPAPTPEG